MCFLGLGRAKLKPNNLLQVKSCDFSLPEISLPGYPPPSQGWIWRSTSKRSLPPSNICSPHPPRQPAFRTDTIKDVLERKTFKSLYLATIFSSTSAFPLGIFSSVASSSSRLSILRSLWAGKVFRYEYSLWTFVWNQLRKERNKRLDIFYDLLNWTVQTFMTFPFSYFEPIRSIGSDVFVWGHIWSVRVLNCHQSEHEHCYLEPSISTPFMILIQFDPFPLLPFFITTLFFIIRHFFSSMKMYVKNTHWLL